MPAPGQSTFDGNPNANPPVTTGYRAGVTGGLSDFGTIPLADDPQFPADPGTMPTSVVWNTICFLLASICRMLEVASFKVVAGASPTMAWWYTAANNIVANPFTIVRVGAGNYQISWAAGLFPVQGDPRGWLHVVGGGGAHNYSIETINITNGVQVTTQQDGVLTDIPFSVAVF